EGEYHFTLTARDQAEFGARVAILSDIMQTEEAAALNQGNARKTRWTRVREDIEREAAKVQEAEEKNRSGAAQMQEKIIAVIRDRIKKELDELSDEDMKKFVEDHLRTQGNWNVTEVKLLALPDDEKKIKIQARVPVKEGDDIRITTKEVEGEVNKFRVTV